MREVCYWRARCASAEVVRTPPEPITASFGTTVTLRRDDGREHTFRIVGEDEADPSRGSVSYVSPLARAIMTGGPGDTVEIAGGKAKILDVW
jgi:transcription elongation GreA/GreB family factor